jgi:hypothetical protein
MSNISIKSVSVKLESVSVTIRNNVLFVGDKPATKFFYQQIMFEDVPEDARGRGSKRKWVLNRAVLSCQGRQTASLGILPRVEMGFASIPWQISTVAIDLFEAA